MTDREALNEFLRGVAVTIGLIGVLILFIAFISCARIAPRMNWSHPGLGWWISIKTVMWFVILIQAIDTGIF